MLITDIALITANFIMFQKIANILSIVSFLMVASMSGGAYFGYKYVTSEQFKAKIMNQIMANVQTLMPKVLDNAIPKTTGTSIPVMPKP
jgi:predicted transcriptional regulator